MDGGEGQEGAPGSGPPTGRPGRLRVDVRFDRGGETVVVAPLGELDHDTAEPLGTALEKHADAARLVVDCAGLDFCDSTGLNLLLRARARALEAGARLDLAGLRPPVDRMFEITGALHVFRVYADAHEALADDPPDGRGPAADGPGDASAPRAGGARPRDPDGRPGKPDGRPGDPV
ncbi:STAS domain-containing protein [Streptomyces sp. R302]|nr:STAS domain-containing protein [Streptomyces sp. R301]NML80745.1 STAS domain-containing protein [Streptomyces sp. R302]